MTITIPVSPTQITKLVSTLTSHVVAAFIQLDDPFTLFALTIVEVVFEKVYFKIVTLTFMLGEHTILTKNFPTFRTLRIGPFDQFQNSIITLFVGTKPQGSVLGSEVEQVHFLIFLFDL